MTCDLTDITASDIPWQEVSEVRSGRVFDFWICLGYLSSRAGARVMTENEGKVGRMCA